MDVMYLADCQGGILVVKVWMGLKVGSKGHTTSRLFKLSGPFQCYGLEEVASVGEVLSLGNLSFRGPGQGHPWPVASLSDQTVVSHNPREHHLRTALSQFQKDLIVVRSMQS